MVNNTNSNSNSNNTNNNNSTNTIEQKGTNSNSINTTNYMTTNKTSSLLYCGLLSGILQAGIFNFWDRALFLSLKENRVFLHKANFSKPFAGMVQSLIQRTLSGGLFFPLEDIYRQQIIYLTDSDSNCNSNGKELTHVQSFLSGLLAGGTLGIILNPASAIKVSLILLLILRKCIYYTSIYYLLCCIYKYHLYIYIYI